MLQALILWIKISMSQDHAFKFETDYKNKLLNSSVYPFSRKIGDGGYRIKTFTNSKSNVLSDYD